MPVDPVDDLERMQVINSDANTTSNYTLFADIVPDNRTLVQAEQTALASLFNT